jgi:hypothetical protein
MQCHCGAKLGMFMAIDNRRECAYVLKHVAIVRRKGVYYVKSNHGYGYNSGVIHGG